MKNLVLIFCLFLSSCAAKAPINLSPTAQTAYTNTQRIQILDVLRDTAISLGDKNVISIATTRRVVQTHETIIKLINNQSSGWQSQAQIVANGILVNLPKSDVDILTPLVNSVLVSLR